MKYLLALSLLLLAGCSTVSEYELGCLDVLNNQYNDSVLPKGRDEWYQHICSELKKRRFPENPKEHFGREGGPR